MAIIYVFKRVVSISGSTVAGSLASLMPGFAKDYFHVYLYIYMFAHWQIHHDWGIYWVHTYIYNYIYILQICILLTDPLHNITPKLLVLLLYRAQIADLGDHSFFKFLFYVVPTITGKPLFVFLK
jgi:hypothetical protein